MSTTPTAPPFPALITCAFCDQHIPTVRLAQHTRDECQALAAKRAKPC
jgi:hypothetical protein